MPELYNRHHKIHPSTAVYIGRGTPWGNRYSHFDYGNPDVILVGSRIEACNLYDDYVRTHPEFQKLIKEQLRGCDLLCSCVPLQCHGQTLLRIANA